MPRSVLAWVCGVAATVGATALATSWMLVGGDRRPLLIGATTDAHHQIELACETCHEAPPFAGADAATQALNATCRDCHEAALRTGDDSHAPRLFRSPRMASYLQALDARLCTSCHVEHRPEITRAGAVTVAADFCAACHSEGDQDVRRARPSHAAATFDNCATAGCHNYHDNRALYEDFLVRHGTAPWLAATPVHRLGAASRVRKPPQAATAASAHLAPAAALTDPEPLREWRGSGHAMAGVGCIACHAPGLASDAAMGAVETQWIVTPDTTTCRDCHQQQATTFAEGRHGMRRHPLVAPARDPTRGLAALGLDGLLPPSVLTWFADPPRPLRMTVAEARLRMREDAAHRSLDCGTCHSPHAVDARHAAVDGCAACHDDAHSRAYFDSPHHALWQAELAGEASPGTGVSCATCHMAKVERRGEMFTSHNQSETLRPNEKVIRPVCLDCHGIAFAIDALADSALVARNFQGKPSVHVESVDWALRRATDDRN